MGQSLYPVEKGISNRFILNGKRRFTVCIRPKKWWGKLFWMVPKKKRLSQKSTFEAAPAIGRSETKSVLAYDSIYSEHIEHDLHRFV